MRPWGDEARLDMDVLVEASVAPKDPESPAAFPIGSEVHDFDALWTGYLLETPEPQFRDSDPPTVLVAMRDEEGGRAIAEVLREAGYAAIAVPTAGAAIRVLATRAIDVVVSEMSATDRTAIQLRNTLRLARPSLRVIVLVDELEVSPRWEPADLVALGYIKKPILGLVFLAALRDAVPLHRRGR